MTLNRTATPRRASVARAAQLLTTDRRAGPRAANGKPPAPPTDPVALAPEPSPPPAPDRLRRGPRKSHQLPPAAHEKPSGWLAEALERGKREAFALVADITPADARALLTLNTENRPLHLPALGRLVRDIAGDQWEFNGESIVVAETGELNDGQHRLAAAENVGKTIRSCIVFGVARASRETLDMGKKRDLADWLSLRGLHNSALLAAACKLVLAYERSRGADFSGIGSFTMHEQLGRATTDAKLQGAVRHATTLFHHSRNLVPGSGVAACLYLLERIDPFAGPWFIDRVCVGDNLARDSAAFETRRVLMMSTSKRRADAMAILLWGWHYHRAGGRVPELVPKLPLPVLNPPASA